MKKCGCGELLIPKTAKGQIHTEEYKTDKHENDPDEVEEKIFAPTGGGFYQCVGVVKKGKEVCSKCHDKVRKAKKEKDKKEKEKL